MSQGGLEKEDCVEEKCFLGSDGDQGNFKLLEGLLEEKEPCEAGENQWKQVLRDRWPFLWKRMAAHLVTG